MSERTVVITVVGEMDRQLREAFGDVDVSTARGVTHLRFVRRDPSMLHGVLARVETLGLEVLDVRIDDEPSEGSPAQR